MRIRSKEDSGEERVRDWGNEVWMVARLKCTWTTAGMQQRPWKGLPSRARRLRDGEVQLAPNTRVRLETDRQDMSL